jgi:hypothetical protein
MAIYASPYSHDTVHYNFGATPRTSDVSCDQCLDTAAKNICISKCKAFSQLQYPYINVNRFFVQFSIGPLFAFPDRQ